MADEKKAAAPEGGESRIVEQSTEHHAEGRRIDPKLAGKYRVTHGDLHLGLKDKEHPELGHTIARRGAIVFLSSTDAWHALHVGSVEPLDESQPGERPPLQFSDEELGQQAAQ